jgi:hypothetical protein
MSRFLARITPVGGDIVLVEQLQRPVDPGYGGGRPGGVDPGFDIPTFPHPGHPLPPSGGRPDQGLPVPPVRPSPPITLPPGMWPPQLPPGTNLPDNSLPDPDQPIFIPPDPSIGIEQPIVIPKLPAGTALLISLANVNVPAPTSVPPGAKPAILVQSGKKPVLVYVSAAQPGGAQPK